MPSGCPSSPKDLIEEEFTRLNDLLRQPPFQTIKRPSTGAIPRTSLLAFIQGWTRRGMCPPCQIIVEHERHALETLLNFLHDPEFASRFEGSAGLCCIHTMRAAARSDSHPHLRTLIEVQRGKYSHLVEELEEFSRKHDYHFSQEPWGAESDSWLRAIELLAGRPGVFGNDVHRMGPGHRTTAWGALRIDRWVRWVKRAIAS